MSLLQRTCIFFCEGLWDVSGYCSATVWNKTVLWHGVFKTRDLANLRKEMSSERQFAVGGGSGNTARDTLMLTGKCQKNQCLLGYRQPGWLRLEADTLLPSTHRRKAKEEPEQRMELATFSVLGGDLWNGDKANPQLKSKAY